MVHIFNEQGEYKNVGLHPTEGVIPVSATSIVKAPHNIGAFAFLTDTPWNRTMVHIFNEQGEYKNVGLQPTEGVIPVSATSIVKAPHNIGAFAFLI